jgi:hypothetical protein
MRRQALIAAILPLAWVACCHPRGSGPTDAAVVEVVRKPPPAPPTIGPTYMESIESVQVDERGPYNEDGRYWPVRVRVKGTVQVSRTSALLFDYSKTQGHRPVFVSHRRARPGGRPQVGCVHASCAAVYGKR